ncbi:MAG: hypothetical protein AB7O96_11000 [Pseudobdellovibrionaceae bacterium]
MNFKVIFPLIVLFAAFAKAKMPHYDLEMTASEYAEVLNSRKFESPNSAKPRLQKILNFGSRNLEWLEKINKDLDDKISFTSPETQPAYPISAPNNYNPDLILGRYDSLLKVMPDKMKAVLLNQSPYTPEPPFDIPTYIEWGFKANQIYEAAARWLMMEPHLTDLSLRRYADVRGHYYLSKENDLKTKLKRWKNLTNTQKINFSFWLQLLCLNAKGNQDHTCARQLQTAIKDDSVWGYYSEFKTAGENMWKNYFRLDHKRYDVTTSSSIYKIPFLNPKNTEVADFLVNNIESEWKYQNWRLDLDFRSSGSIPRIQFIPGVTPNVNRIGGNIITMDSNQPLTEYSVQWIIRHEFGHVVGFKDCYMEFYDSRKKTITAYQLDTENLMCSRRGHIKETHLSELKRVYKF